MNLKFSIFVIFVHLIILGHVCDGSFSLFPSIFGHKTEESDNDINHGFGTKLIKIFYPVYRIQYSNNQNKNQQKTPELTDSVIKLKSPLPNLVEFETLPSNQLNELPDDLMQLAGNLGIHDLSQIPSLTEMSELLGTQTPQETIDFIRQFAKTSDGLDFIRSFITSYNENDESEENFEKQLDTKSKSATGRTLSSSSPKFESYVESAETDLEILRKVLTTPKPELGFFGRISSYLNVFDTNSESKEISIEPFASQSMPIQPQQRQKIGKITESVPLPQSNIAVLHLPHQQILYRPSSQVAYRHPYTPISPVYNHSPKNNVYLPYLYPGIIPRNTNDKFQKPIRVIPTKPATNENQLPQHLVSAQDINEIFSDNNNFISPNDKHENVPETNDEIIVNRVINETNSMNTSSHYAISQPIIKNNNLDSGNTSNFSNVPKSVADLELVDRNWTVQAPPKNSYGAPILQWPISFDVKSRQIQSKKSDEDFNGFDTNNRELTALLQGPVFKREQDNSSKQ